jgi:hypothetical protein
MGFDRRLVALVVVTLSLLAPAALCAGVAFVPVRSPADLVALALAGAAWMVLLWQVNWWGFTAWWLRWFWLAALAAAIAIRVAPAAVPPAGAAGPVAWVALGLLAAALWLLVPAIRGRHHRGPALDLAFPLAGGRFLVADGGDGARSFLLNYHFAHKQHRAIGVNGSMRYAMDVVEVGRLWGEAFGFLPRKNYLYLIWEKPLYAPCDGKVVHVVNNVEDNVSFGYHRPDGLGNHVVLEAAGGTYVVLGHLRCGSAAVAEGETVRAGQALGRVGNSGWTERPHLHLQAMRSAAGDWWHGQPLPMRFRRRFLVRNQVLRA